MFATLRLPIQRLASVFLLAGIAMSLSEPVLPEYHDGDSAPATVAADAPSSPADQQQRTNHNADAVHVCHCVHVHGISATVASVRGTPDAFRANVPTSSVKLPASWEVPPALRPPIG